MRDVRSRVTYPVEFNAAELADTEALRGYDAVHLAASLAVDAGMFVSPDAALCAAARRRGLYVANPLES